MHGSTLLRHCILQRGLQPTHIPLRPLVILHGLFGRAIHWRSLAQDPRLCTSRDIILLDSSHTPEFTYPQLANLALQQLDELKIETCHIAGHSMGGKTAMYLSLHHPDRFASTVVVDSAPVNYVGESWWIVPQMVQAVVSAPLPSPQQHLMTALGDRRLVQFLMTNLNRDRSGWLVDVAAVARDYAQIGSFPDLPAELNSPKPALFVAGGESMHTRRIYDAVIRARFPKAQITRISGAAHWVQVDAPDAFCDSVCRFLDAIDPA